jgi:vitamin B12 transporter
MKKQWIMVAAAMVSGQAFAQDNNDSTTRKTLDEVVVTANKTPQKQSTTGKVITVINKDQINKSAGKSLGQVLNEQAGITINGALNTMGTNQTIYVRGAASGRALVLIDGIPVNDPSLISNEFDLNLLSLNDVERIEIARGAQSTLYGSDAVAGVINIITQRKDQAGPLNLKGMVSAGNNRTLNGGMQLSGKTGKLSYSATYNSLKTRGFSSAEDSTGTNNYDNDGFDGYNTGALLKYQFVPALSLAGFFRYNNYRTDNDASAFTDDRDFTTRSKNLIAGSKLQYNRNRLFVNATYQYSDIKRIINDDSLHQGGFSKFSNDDYFGRNQFIEAFATYNLGAGVSFLAGGDYRFSSMNNEYLSISAWGPFESAFNDTSLYQYSGFASAFYRSRSEKLNIELGGRYNKHSRYGENFTYTFNPSYSINSNLRVFGSIASAYKTPSLYQLYSSYGNKDLKPEKSTTFEVGIQQQHARISNRVVFFHRNITDGLDFDYNNFQYFNINEQTVNGIELESSWTPVRGLVITGNYTYLDPTEDSQSRLTFKDSSYSYLLKRPDHQLNLQAGYQFRNGFYAAVGGKYVSSRYDVGGYQVPDVKLDAYVIFNAQLSYSPDDRIRVFANAQNLTDKKFTEIRGYNSIPFLLTGGIVFNWGK